MKEWAKSKLDTDGLFDPARSSKNPWKEIEEKAGKEVDSKTSNWDSGDKSGFGWG